LAKFMAIELKLKELELKAEGFGTVLQQVPVSSCITLTRNTTDI
jgi:hypothetical protein